jgi:hypothetical protein
MKLAALALTLAACGGSQAPANTSTTTSTASGASPTVVQASGTTASSSTAQVATGTVNKRPDYSCFSYTSRNSKDQRTACMRTSDCAPYLDQAKQVGGIVEVSGCANANVVFCFATGEEEVCQPTLESCTAERALLVKKGTSVTGDCTRI